MPSHRMAAALLATLVVAGCERRNPVAPQATLDELLASPAGWSMRDVMASYAPPSALQPNKAIAFNHVAGPVITGGDLGGGNLTPPDGAVLSGTFTNVGDFTIGAGRTVHAAPGTVLSISAARIVID